MAQLEQVPSLQRSNSLQMSKHLTHQQQQSAHSQHSKSSKTSEDPAPPTHIQQQLDLNKFQICIWEATNIDGKYFLSDPQSIAKLKQIEALIEQEKERLASAEQASRMDESYFSQRGASQTNNQRNAEILTQINQSMLFQRKKLAEAALEEQENRYRQNIIKMKRKRSEIKNKIKAKNEIPIQANEKQIRQEQQMIRQREQEEIQNVLVKQVAKKQEQENLEQKQKQAEQNRKKNSMKKASNKAREEENMKDADKKFEKIERQILQKNTIQQEGEEKIVCFEKEDKIIDEQEEQIIKQNERKEKEELVQDQKGEQIKHEQILSIEVEKQGKEIQKQESKEIEIEKQELQEKEEDSIHKKSSMKIKEEVKQDILNQNAIKNEQEEKQSSQKVIEAFSQKKDQVDSLKNQSVALKETEKQANESSKSLIAKKNGEAVQENRQGRIAQKQEIKDRPLAQHELCERQDSQLVLSEKKEKKPQEQKIVEDEEKGIQPLKNENLQKDKQEEKEQNDMINISSSQKKQASLKEKQSENQFIRKEEPEIIDENTQQKVKQQDEQDKGKEESEQYFKNRAQQKDREGEKQVSESSKAKIEEQKPEIIRQNSEVRSLSKKLKQDDPNISEQREHQSFRDKSQPINKSIKSSKLSSHHRVDNQNLHLPDASDKNSELLQPFDDAPHEQGQNNISITPPNQQQQLKEETNQCPVKPASEKSKENSKNKPSEASWKEQPEAKISQTEAKISQVNENNSIYLEKSNKQHSEHKEISEIVESKKDEKSPKEQDESIAQSLKSQEKHSEISAKDEEKEISIKNPSFRVSSKKLSLHGSVNAFDASANSEKKKQGEIIQKQLSIKQVSAKQQKLQNKQIENIKSIKSRGSEKVIEQKIQKSDKMIQWQKLQQSERNSKRQSIQNGKEEKLSSKAQEQLSKKSSKNNLMSQKESKNQKKKSIEVEKQKMKDKVSEKKVEQKVEKNSQKQSQRSQRVIKNEEKEKGAKTFIVRARQNSKKQKKYDKQSQKKQEPSVKKSNSIAQEKSNAASQSLNYKNHQQIERLSEQMKILQSKLQEVQTKQQSIIKFQKKHHNLVDDQQTDPELISPLKKSNVSKRLAFHSKLSLQPSTVQFNHFEEKKKAKIEENQKMEKLQLQEEIGKLKKVIRDLQMEKIKSIDHENASSVTKWNERKSVDLQQSNLPYSQRNQSKLDFPSAKKNLWMSEVRTETFGRIVKNNSPGKSSVFHSPRKLNQVNAEKIRHFEEDAEVQIYDDSQTIPKKKGPTFSVRKSFSKEPKNREDYMMKFQENEKDFQNFLESSRYVQEPQSHADTSAHERYVYSHNKSRRSINSGSIIGEQSLASNLKSEVVRNNLSEIVEKMRVTQPDSSQVKVRQIHINDIEMPDLPGDPSLQMSQSQLLELAKKTFKALGKNVDAEDFTNQLVLKKYKNCVIFSVTPTLSECILWHYSGKFYYGGWRNNDASEGEKTGEGLEYIPGKHLYKGQFLAGKKNGNGILKTQNGNIYDGQWIDGVKNGRGTYFQVSSKSLYSGEWKDGKRDGYGILKFSQNQFYEGTFQKSIKNGYGVEMFANGDVYKGQYLKGKFHGKGKYFWANGSSYEGDFSEGKRHGHGSWRSLNKDGDIYVGVYQNDKKCGYGRYLWANGCVYEGYFKNDRKHGQGKLVYQDGKQISGKWEDGNLVQSQNSSRRNQELEDEPLKRASKGNLLNESPFSGRRYGGYP